MRAMSEPASIAPDGRRARRDRNRVAVVDAVYELLVTGVTSPGAEQIAQRAGVSVSSVFRYFDGLDDLHEQTIARHFELHAEFFNLRDPGTGPLPDRIERFVDSRLELYERIAPVARVARIRGPEHARIGAALAAIRRSFADQVRAQFAPELMAFDLQRAQDVIALADVLTSFESWELHGSVHGATPDEVRRSWIRGLDAILGPC